VHDASLPARQQLGIVGENGTRADEHGVGRRAEPLHHRPGTFGADPAGLPRSGGDPTIQSGCKLEAYEGSAALVNGEESAVVFATRRLEHTDLYLDSPGKESSHSATPNPRVRIPDADEHPGDPRIYDRSGAGPGSPAKAAWLQRDGERGATHRAGAEASRGPLQSEDLGMSPTRRLRESASQDPGAAEEHGPHRRIRKRPPRGTSALAEGESHRGTGVHGP
jgi:hypothetical protein